MAKIENPKNYSGRDLETIFFRPMLSGPDARALGIKVMYNTPVPTTLQFWKRAGDILQKYTAAGWKGGDAATKYSKQIALSKVKAEAGYSAEDYFNMVYELITGRPDVNLDDLTGTELEAAETALFKEAIAESIRATMWLGDTEREGALSTFDGFLKRLLADTGDTENDVRCTGFDPAGETRPKSCSNGCGTRPRTYSGHSSLRASWSIWSRRTYTPATKRSSTASHSKRPIWPSRTDARACRSGAFR